MLVLGGVVALARVAAVDAQSGTIVCRGSIEAPGVSLTSTTVTATAGAVSASTTTTTGHYVLDLPVPGGERASYTIAASAYYPDGYLTFPPQTVVVAAGEATTADFVMATGTAQAMVATTGEAIANVTIYWFGENGAAGYRSVNVNAGLASIGVPVAAGDVTLWATVFLKSGESLFLGYRSTSVIAGSVTPVSWSVDDLITPPMGLIASLPTR